MKSNKEYHFKECIRTVSDVRYRLRYSGFSVNLYCKCDLTGKTISYRMLLPDLEKEYEVTGLEDCLKFIVNDAVMLGEMIKSGAIAED